MFVSFSLLSLFIFIALAEASSLSFVLLVCIFFVFHLISCRFISGLPSLLEFLLLLQFGVACVFFSAPSLLMLFISYEFSLFPMCLIILLFGYQPEKLSATLWLLVYLVVSGLPLLVWVIVEIGSLVNGFFCLTPYSCFLVALSFIFKTPLYTLHLWLPKAHVEAPLVGSMFLSGILLNMGGYGILILSPFIHIKFSIFFYLSLIGSVMCGITCFRCWDLKSWVAFSSVVHIGIVTLGALGGTEVGSWAALSMLVSHSLISPLLFCFAAQAYAATSSRSFLLSFTSSLSPVLHLVLALLLGTNFGLPPSLGFWSELSVFWAIGSLCFFFLLVLSVSSFFCFLYCAIYYVLLVSGHMGPIAIPASPFIFYLPSLFFCFASPFSCSFFLVT